MLNHALITVHIDFYIVSIWSSFEDYPKATVDTKCGGPPSDKVYTPGAHDIST